MPMIIRVYQIDDYMFFFEKMYLSFLIDHLVKMNVESPIEKRTHC
jgi:hypothetical protein